MAKRLASETGAAHVRIDSIEQGLRDICGLNKIEAEGYQLAYVLAADILASGCSVVADSVNPLEATRDAWMEAATSSGADFVNIEIICSDVHEHQQRVENRDVGIANLKLPAWKQVQARDYQNWTISRLQLDTAGKRIEESFRELLSALSRF